MLFGTTMKRMRVVAFLSLILAIFFSVGASVWAHPLGNFTINHFTNLSINDQGIRLRALVDLAEIPTFQEVQRLDTNSDGQTSEPELNAYLETFAAQYTEGLIVTVDDEQLPVELTSKNILLRDGEAGLSTMRMELGYQVAFRASLSAASHRVRFENRNQKEKLGWREITVGADSGLAVFDSTAYSNSISNELQAYPEDQLQAPLNERTADFSFTKGATPAGAQSLMTRDGKAVSVTRDRFAELIAVPELTPTVVLLGLLIAAVLGAAHALSPGHGKTVVGAYLVGTRGTAKHALFLGATVTITHTLGVFALGLVTLFASQYVLPEKLFPILSLASGLLVAIIGLSLFRQRLFSAIGLTHGHHHPHDHSHPHPHDHAHAPEVVQAHAHSLHHMKMAAHTHGQHAHDHNHDHRHDHAHNHDHHHDHAHDHDQAHGHSHAEHHLQPDALTHTHGGSTHTHALPGADGSPVTWRSLLALGISGGLLPCPSALVVMLSAIYLNRVGYGLVLVIAFSFGLAATLTAVGLLFVYAGRLMKEVNASNRWFRLLPVASALVITGLGLLMCYEALRQVGVISSPFASIG